MGAYSERQLRAAFTFILRPLALAVCLTLVARLLFGPVRPKETFSKALVIASTSDQPTSEIGWIQQVPKDWTVFNYVTDAPTSAQLSVPVNKGNEAMVYLTYIIDNYHSLPDVVFFHHSHRKGWHQELDSLSEVQHLRPSYVTKKGYVSTRCLPGCENIIPLATYSVDPSAYVGVGRDVQLASLLDEFMDRRRGEMVPTKLAAPCCSQFAVSRETIQGRSLVWWKRLRQWLLDTPLDNMTSGRLLEYTWHVWFGEETYQ